MGDAGPVVSNTGPIIAMASIGQFELLRALFGTILLPRAVFEELTCHGVDRPGARQVSEAAWMVTVDLDVPPDPLLAEELGAGESEAITLARQRQASWLLLDDRRARRIAELAYTLPVKGTAGLVVLAKSRGLVSAVSPLLDQIRSRG